MLFFNILKLGLSTTGHVEIYAWRDLPAWAVGFAVSAQPNGANLLSNGE